MTRAVACFLCWLAWAAAAVPGAASAAPAYSEAEVKAAFLLRFASYVEWPAAVLSQPAFVVGVVGDEAVHSALLRLAELQRVNGKAVRVRELRTLRDPHEVAILYVGGAARPAAAAAGDALHRPGTLVVTHQRRGLASGAAINFVVVDRRVRFEVSMTAVRRAGLNVNSGLLSVATRVEDERRGAIWCVVQPAGAGTCERRMLASAPAEVRWRRPQQRRRT